MFFFKYILFILFSTFSWIIAFVSFLRPPCWQQFPLSICTCSYICCRFRLYCWKMNAVGCLLATSFGTFLQRRDGCNGAVRRPQDTIWLSRSAESKQLGLPSGRTLYETLCYCVACRSAANTNHGYYVSPEAGVFAENLNEHGNLSVLVTWSVSYLEFIFSLM